MVERDQKTKALKRKHTTHLKYLVLFHENLDVYHLNDKEAYQTIILIESIVRGGGIEKKCVKKMCQKCVKKKKKRGEKKEKKEEQKYNK